MARARGLPASPGPRSGRAGQRLRALALRGRGHQARPPRQGVGDPPDLLVRGAARGDPGAPARAPVRRSRGPGPADGQAPRRRLHGLLPPGQGGVRGGRRAARRRGPGARLPAHRHVPRAGRALRRLPLEPVVPGPASLGRRPQPRGRCEQPPAACAQAPGGGHAARPGRAGAADGPTARGRRTGGPGARPRAGPDPGPERGSRRGAVGAASARARRGSHARPDARPAGPAGAQPRRPVPGPRGGSVRARRRRGLPVRHPRASADRGRSPLRRFRRDARPEVPRDLEPRRRWPGHVGEREGRLRADGGPDHGPLGGRTERSTSTTTRPTSGRRWRASPSATARASSRWTA